MRRRSRSRPRWRRRPRPSATQRSSGWRQQIDIADPGSVLRFGAEAQSRATAAADAMLEGARNREAGEAGVTLSSLLGTLRGFDMSGLAAKRGFFARVFNRAGAEAARVLQRYETIKGQVEEVGDRLDTPPHPAARGRGEAGAPLRRDARMVPRPRRPHRGRRHRARSAWTPRRSRRVTREVEGGDSVAAQRLRDLRSARDELERRVHDLRLTRQVAMQALPSIRLIQENDKALASKIQSVIANTVPLWRQQLAQALAIQNMREAGQTLKQATDLTNELLDSQRRAAARGQPGSAHAARTRRLRHRGGEEGERVAGGDHRGQPAHRPGRAGAAAPRPPRSWRRPRARSAACSIAAKGPRPDARRPM